MNEYDSNRILDLVKSVGYKPTKEIEESDCYILNTCHIREKATEKVYHDVGRLRKVFNKKKKPILLITGCVAQAEGEEMLKREKYIDGVVGPQSYHEIPNILKKIEKNKVKINSTEFNVVEKFDKLNVIKNKNSKVSSFLTIQEGCDKFCNFCVVPYTRGSEYSRSLKEILLEAKDLINNGTKEIILLGQNVNAYNNNKNKLSDLIFELNELNGLERIRFTTSHPKDMSKDLINTYKNCNKLMPYLHLPVQSGSTKILKNMNRKHSIEEYRSILKELKEKKPNIKFSSDFIIGYPGETDEDFQKSLILLKDIKFINTFSFIYSQRPGTPAATSNNFNFNESKKRLIIFQNIADKIKREYREKLMNKEVKVLFENKMKDNVNYFGRDEFQNSVVVKSNINLTGKTLSVKIINFNISTLFGEIIKNKYMAA
jgi:tRNA-2-methylthio-N6-dimethylallyladenosine synthase